MTRGLRRTTQFKRDAKRTQKRGKDLDKLWTIVERLLDGRDLELRHRRHRLSGDWADFEECHIEPDWLLIWTESVDAVTLVRTGSHADLFE